MLHLPAPLEAAGRLTSSAGMRTRRGRPILGSLDGRSNSALKLAHDPVLSGSLLRFAGMVGAGLPPSRVRRQGC